MDSIMPLARRKTDLLATGYQLLLLAVISVVVNTQGNSTPPNVVQCSFNPCENGATCYLNSNTTGGWVCACRFGYTGVLCGTELLSPETPAATTPTTPYYDPCLSARHECLNNGTCLNEGNGNARCICAQGFVGDNCALKVQFQQTKNTSDACFGVDCGLNKRCVSRGSLFICIPSTTVAVAESSKTSHSPFTTPVLFASATTKARKPQMPDINLFNDAALGDKPILIENTPTDGTAEPQGLCRERPCYNDANCTAIQTQPFFACACPRAWSGLRCERDVDECAASVSPCKHGATCINTAGGYQCVCRPGTSGLNCEQNTNDCLGVDCQNGGSCVDDVGGYKCMCAVGWTGENCTKRFNVCDPSPCQNNAFCSHSESDQRGFSCACRPGFVGAFCERNIDDCVGVVCPNAGEVCVDRVQFHECRCPEGWTGPNCYLNIDECQQTPSVCENGATCQDNTGNYTCVCREGFTGRHCEQDLNECDQNMCLNGATCRNSLGGYQCYCRPGFVGRQCELNFDDCQSNPCQHGGVCVDSVNDYRCLCPHAYTGRNCQSGLQENACFSSPCLNDGSCQSDLFGFSCLCGAGFTGTRCEFTFEQPQNSTTVAPLFSTQALTSNGSEATTTTTVDITTEEPTSTPTTQTVDPCQGVVCYNGGSCQVESASAVRCLCAGGYTGSRCESQHVVSVSACVSSPCAPAAVCVVANNSDGYVCHCARGFDGSHCRQDIDECQQSPTICGLNARSCVNTLGGYRCVCKRDWTGAGCTVALTGCVSQHMPCPAAHECVPVLSGELHGFECRCPAGTAGDECQKATVASFNGDSVLGYVVANASDVSLYVRLSFRTTLSDATASLMSGVTVVGRTVYELTLEQEGKSLRLDWRDANVTLITSENLVDGHWHNVLIDYAEGRAKLSLLDENGAELVSVTVVDPNGGAIGSLFTTRIGGGSNSLSTLNKRRNFIGCIRDISVNYQSVIPSEQAVNSINVGLKCDRRQQCFADTCARNGICVDRWSSYECQCKRPYLPPACHMSIPEATFGQEGNRSYAQIQMTRQEESSLEQDLDVSLLLRTRALNGGLLYIGSEMGPQQSTVDTFVAVEIRDGQLHANVKLGGQRIHSFVGGPMLNDGRVYEIAFRRHRNNLRATVDGIEAFSGKLDHPFPHPLLATHFYIGGYPTPFPNTAPRHKRQIEDGDSKRSGIDPSSLRGGSSVSNPEAFTTAKTFKGTLQDVRVNGEHIILFPPLSAELSSAIGGNHFGIVHLNGNVLNGTVSDDTCRRNPCGNGAECNVTFNDYSCECRAGWRGKNCTIIDYCTRENVCVVGSDCMNYDEGYQCLSAATFQPTSQLKLEFSPGAHNTTVPLFYTISFDVRTRSRQGALLFAHDTDNYLLISFDDGGLTLKYRLGGTEVQQTNLTRHTAITDGKWHSIKLTLLTERSHIEVDNRAAVIDLIGSDQVLLPISDVLEQSQLHFGAPSLDQLQAYGIRHPISARTGFKGCLNHVHLGGNDVPQLSLSAPETYGQMTRHHFRPIAAKHISTQCRKDPVCTEPDPIRGLCENGATCDDLWNKYECQCVPGFNGTNCETNIDDCVDNKCTENGTCVDGIQNYTCNCLLGFTGEFCETEIDECASNPCENEGTCENLVGKFNCLCNANYTGDTCQILIRVDCASSPCQNGASCEDATVEGQKSFKCQCPPGYEGRACEKEIDYCKGTPCQNNATCVSVRAELDYKCSCLPGYQGKRCETDINECASIPCANGGTCDNLVNQFKCTCPTGFEGTTCSVDINECERSNPCQHGLCVNSAGSYRCECPNGYLGVDCELTGVCVSSSVAKCGENGFCRQGTTVDEYECRCKRGYKGDGCDTLIDYCTPSPCHNDANCTRSIGEYTCQCPPGVTGKNCSVEVNECASDPCVNDGVCVDGRNAFTCRCASGFTGATCEQDVDECQRKESCVNGVCTNTRGDYACRCTTGHIGRRCAHADPCRNVTTSGGGKQKQLHECAHDGVCFDPLVTIDSGVETVKYSCKCPDGFEGTRCEVEKVKGRDLPLTYIAGTLLGLLLLISLGVCCVFLLMARKQRATRGTYSPSRQEQTGSRMPMGHMMKPPPEERLI